MLVLSSALASAWSNDPANPTVVCNAIGQQTDPHSVPDGTGGAIVGWTDDRSSTRVVHAQRLSADGTPQWAGNGIAVSDPEANVLDLRMVTDAANGAILSWLQLPEGMARLQRVGPDGTAIWNSGNPIGLGGDPAGYSDIVSDGEGGVFVVYSREGSHYVQRISAAGTQVWPGEVSLNVTDMQELVLAQTPNHGLLLAWNSNDIHKIRAQQIDSTGTLLWGPTGVAVSATTVNEMHGPAITDDGSGGAVVTWDDYDNVNRALKAQRIATGGSRAWGDEGTNVCATGVVNVLPAAIAMSSGSVVIAWTTAADWGQPADLHAQKLALDSTPQWGPGVTLAADPSMNEYWPVLLADGTGGAYVQWNVPDNSDVKVAMQHLGSDGSTLWPMRLTLFADAEFSRPCFASDGTIFSAAGTTDIFAVKVYTTGQLVPVRLSGLSLE